MSKREYEMLFQLSAQENGSFSGTFSKAQQQLSGFSREIQELSKMQGDISAYQKQQQAVESTQKKLEVLQQQYDNIQREIQETGEFSSDLENKLLAKQQQIDKTTASLEKQTGKLDEMGSALQKAGVNTNDLQQESERLGAEMIELKKRQEEVTESTEDYGSTAAVAFNAVSSAIAAAGIAVALKEIYEAYAECVSIAGDFEASLSNVEALSGATNEEMARLSDLAKELGATTKYTAKESADAMGYMAMAGWSAEQMIAGMPGVLQLAAASGEDLATVSDIVTDSLTAFGLSAADTNRYADILAATAANANTNVSMMGETFKVVAPLAGSLGYDVEDLAVATGLMANAGIKGSEAGTSLRGILTRLAKPTKESADAMEALGLSLTDDQGRMYSFMEIMERMRDSFSGLTEDEKAFYAAELAGQRGMSALLNIVNAAEKDFADLSDSITNSTGAAQEMANIKMDNMVGQLTLLQSAWEACQTTVGEQFTPILSELYGKFAGIISEINGFLQKNPALIKAVTAFVGVLGLVVGGITAYTVAAKVAATASTLLAEAIPGVNVIMGVSAAVAGLAAMVAGLSDEFNDAVPPVSELTEAAREMRSMIKDAADTYDDTVASTTAAANVADNYISKLEDLKAQGLETDEQQRDYHNTLLLLTQTVPELAQYIDLETDSIAGGTEALRANTEAWKQNAIAQAYQDELSSVYKAYSNVLVEAERNSIGLTKAQIELEAVQKIHGDMLKRQAELWDEATAAADAYNKANNDSLLAESFLTDEYRELEAALADVSDEMWRAEKKVKNYETAITEGKEAVANAEAEIATAEEAVRRLSDTTDMAADSAVALAEQELVVNNAIADTVTQVSELTKLYQAAYEEAYKSITGQYSLWDEADKVAATSADTINKALGSQITYWEDYNANLASLSSRASDVEGLSDVIASFADGSKDSVNAIAGMAAASDADLKQMVKQWQDLQKTQAETSDAIAEFKTDFQQQMEELTQELQADIKALDLSADAAANGRATIQAFIDSAADMENSVRRAYAKLGVVAAAALGSGKLRAD